MPTAAGEFVKIYIYLIKCLNDNVSELSISKIADVFNNTEKDTIRALKYWHKKGLLKLTFESDQVTSLVLYDCDRQSEGGPDAQPCEPVKVTATVKTTPLPEEPERPSVTVREYNAEELARFREKDEIAELIFVIQKYLGKTVTSSDLNRILFFYEELNFSPELIEYLVEYCVSLGHANMRYIEKTAINWADSGVKDVTGAKLLNSVFTDNCYPVMRAFGLTGRNPVESEIEYVKKWALSYDFDADIVTEACSRTMAQLHKPSFEYADSILRRWHESGVHTTGDIKKLDEEFKNSRRTAGERAASSKLPVKIKAGSFNDFEQRDVDMGRLEEQLLTAGRNAGNRS